MCTPDELSDMAAHEDQVNAQMKHLRAARDAAAILLFAIGQHGHTGAPLPDGYLTEIQTWMDTYDTDDD